MSHHLGYLAVVGLTEAMYLWLIAAGLSLTFGVLRVVNFAHGSLYMLGAYLTFSVIQAAGGNYWLGLLIGPILLMGVGWLMERFFFRRLYQLDHAFQLLLTFAFVLVFDDLVKIVWGPVFHSVPVPPILSGTVSVFGQFLPVFSLFNLFVGIVVSLGLWWLIEHTNIGALIQATAADREIAATLGVNVPRIYTAVFVFGSWLAGIGGALSVPTRSLSPGMGEAIIIEAFVVVVIGGLGSLKGAFLGAILIGLLHAYGVMFLPVFELALAYIAMATVLILRPWGLFGAKE
ncbi:MAG: branched-chain amino acid ABC transporter permease [Rhodospirillales bacterium]|nr:branched-chain amino acid ABC transporter permease [Rhodospirillales bacterium]